MKTGIIDVGGGLRDIYGAGVFDRLMDDGVTFDYAIGISAGSANLTMFTSHQRGNSYRYYTEFVFRREYISPANYLKVHSLMNLDYIYGEIPNSEGEAPIDYEAFRNNPMEFLIEVLNANSGQPEYFHKNEIEKDNYIPLMASSALPPYSHPYVINGNLYFDGGLADPLPLQKALDDGCDKVVLLLTKPRDVKRPYDEDKKATDHLRKKGFYKAAISCKMKAYRYNKAIELAEKLEKEGKVLIVSPDDTCGVSVLTRDREKLDRLYQKGYQDGGKVQSFLKEQ